MLCLRLSIGTVSFQAFSEILRKQSGPEGRTQIEANPDDEYDSEDERTNGMGGFRSLMRGWCAVAQRG